MVFLKRRSFSYITISFFIIFSLIGLLLFPKNAAASAKSALLLCAGTVIPSLFPFFVFSKLFTSLRLSDIFCKLFAKIMPFFFSVNGNLSAAFIIGFCGGYPTGAVTVAELYSKKLCTKQEAERALAFCNNTGPAFIVGAVGIGLLGNVKAGLMLFLIHILSAFFVGISFRVFSPISEHYSNGEFARERIPSFSFAFTDAISSSTQAILSVSAYIVFFSVLVSILSEMKILTFVSVIASKLCKLDLTSSKAFITGIFEMTCGVEALVKSDNFTVIFALSAALISFGGISVHAQTMNFISKQNLSTKEYFIGKLLQSLFSVIFALLISHTIDFSPCAVNTFSEKFTSYTQPSIFLSFPLLLGIIYIFCKKGWKNEKI